MPTSKELVLNFGRHVDAAFAAAVAQGANYNELVGILLGGAIKFAIYNDLEEIKRRIKKLEKENDPT